MMNLSNMTWNNGTISAWLLVATFGCSGGTSLGGAGDAGIGGAMQSGTGGATPSSSGGAINTGGAHATGGTTCGVPECFEAFECATRCDSPTFSYSCCPCGDGMVDRRTACVGVGGNASIGGSTATGGTTGAGYSPCGGKKCGDICTICAPNDSTCAETNMLKACDSYGSCVGSSLVTCNASGGAPATGGATSTSTYQPCAGKGCGDLCTICPPNSTGCAETAVVKSCNSAGQCLAGTQQCTTTTGGTSSAGGSTSVGGKSGTGGRTYTCDPNMECFHANVCVETCGGPVIGTGCCQCPSGTFDQSTQCSAASGGAPSSGGASAMGGTGGMKCGANVCGANETCCNPSCGICTRVGDGCITIECMAGGSTSLGGASGTSPSSSISGLHADCTNRTCATELTPIQFYGIAGPSGPLFCSCEIPCSGPTDRTTCPTGLACTHIADGPGNVCY